MGDFFDTTARPQFHAGGFGGIEKALNNCLRRVTDRKHASVRLSIEVHIPAFEPVDRVAGTEAAERSDQFLRTARVARYELWDIETRVGHVAAAATGHADFGEKLWAALQNCDGAAGASFRACDGGKETSGATSNNYNSL